MLPHFDRIEQWAPGIVERRAAGLTAGQVLVGIDEETAIVSRPDGWGVEGRQNVWIVDPEGRRTPHAAGALLPLPAVAPGHKSVRSGK